MTKIYKLILVCCAALFLSACAHPDMIKLNDTYDYTVKELGVPDSTTRLHSNRLFHAADGPGFLRDDL